MKNGKSRNGPYFNVLEKRQTNNNKLRGGWQEGVKGAPRVLSEEGARAPQYGWILKIKLNREREL